MSNYKKQTAVEWLIEQFWNNEGMLTSKKLEQALEMEYKQMIEFGANCIKSHSKIKGGNK
jgi:hypothetical protein